MPAGQSLKGFVSQSMRPGKSNKRLQEPFVFPWGASYVFKPPKAGYWKFVLWGAGGDGSVVTAGGASGAYVEVTKFLTLAQTVTLVVGEFALNYVDTTATFPDGSIASAGRASVVTGGIATGGDVNLNGSPGTAGSTSSNGATGAGTGGGPGGLHSAAADGGAGAPAMLPYRGGHGQMAGTNSVGHGAGNGQGGTLPGPGLAIAVYMRA